MTQRRGARESALEVFYRFDIGSENTEKTIKEIEDRINFSPQGKMYFQRLVSETSKNLETIDKTIKQYLKHWSFARLAGVDRAILRIACCELLFFSDIPPKVIINEALEIAKKYGSEESARFVNGMLDAIYKNKAIEKK
jgi:N utilization substance protein B